MSRDSQPPGGWTEEEVRRLAGFYDSQTDDEAVAEHEAAHRSKHHTLMAVPVELVPKVRELIAKQRAS